MISYEGVYLLKSNRKLASHVSSIMYDMYSTT